MTLADVIARNAAFAPGKAALRFEGASLTYGELTQRIERAAAALSGPLGVGRGDRVAVLAHNHPDTLVLLYACARIGAMLLPLNWRLADPELAFILGHAEPRALVVEDAFAPHLPAVVAGLPGSQVVGLGEGRAVAPRLDDLLGEATSAAPRDGTLSDPVLLVYTSGTTGRPKGAVLTQEALAWNGVMSQHMHGLTSRDHVLTVLPFFHVGGLNIQTTPALQLGATVTIQARFAPDEALRTIAADRPTLTVLVPATLGALLADPGFAGANLSSLRAISTGSSYVPQPLIDPFEARGVPVLQVYGATETGPVSIYTRSGGARPAGSTGWPGLLCDVRLVDEPGDDVPDGASGEVLLKGPNLFSGYWRDAAATREALQDGWFRTGDIAMRDGQGAFFVHDRKKNVIISGGENIYPAEIERVLLEHPAIADAGVVGRPDPRWEEVPVAHVVRRAGKACTATELAAHCARQLARFKLPKDFVFAESLPKSALGKVQHHLLRSSSPGAEGEPGIHDHAPESDRGFRDGQKASPRNGRERP